MHSQHVNPQEAVEIHRDIRATHSVGVHWGTFHIGREVRPLTSTLFVH